MAEDAGGVLAVTHVLELDGGWFVRLKVIRPGGVPSEDGDVMPVTEKQAESFRLLLALAGREPGSRHGTGV